MGRTHTHARARAHTHHTTQSRCESKTHADELGLLLAFGTVSLLVQLEGLAW